MPRENKHLKALTFRMNLALEKRRAAEAEIRLLDELIKDCQPKPKKAPTLREAVAAASKL